MSQTPVDIESQHSDDYSLPDQADDETVVLNVGGVKYEVRPSTLYKYPNTLLGNLFHPSNKNLRKPDKKGEYFFDRNGRFFEVVLNFYRTGKLVIPSEIPQELIKEELRYFKLSYDDEETQENEDDKIMKQPRDQIYTYANSLIHSSSKYDIKRGLYFLQRLRELDSNSFLYKYSIAFAYYRLGKNKEGVETLEDILATDPHNPQALSLMALFGDSRLTNVTVGVVAVSLLLLGMFGLWKVRSWWRAAAIAASTATATTAAVVGPSAGTQVIRSAAASPAVHQSVANAVQSTIGSVIPAAANAGKSIASSIAPSAIHATVTSTPSEVATTLAEMTIAAATPVTIETAESITSATFLEAMNSSLPNPNQFRR
eukprot:gene13834-16311_t